MRNLPIQTMLSAACAGAALAAAGLVRPAQFMAVVELSPETTVTSPLRARQQPEPVRLSPAMRPGLKTPAIEEPRLLEDSNGGLDAFYKALWRSEGREPEAITRIVHYGDSPTTADLITGDVRRQLQARFGDAGHGFVLIAKPWAWYQHTGVSVSGWKWEMAPASRFKPLDGAFGLGGVSFTGESGARSSIRFQDPSQTRFAIWFEEQPGGGRFSVTADGKPAIQVDTAAAARTPAVTRFDVEGGAADVEITVDQGPVRVFGMTAEKAGPGVVYDSLGLNGASITVLSRMFGAAHWAAELRQRRPDLVVINYGTNEADFASFIDRQYEPELREAIRRVRVALPEASILVMSPMDRGERNGEGIETMATIPRIVAVQRRVALDTGCGFFDTFDAMGGTGTMARWYAAEPRLVSADLIHPYPAGGKIVATVFVKELEAGLNRYKLREQKLVTTSGVTRPAKQR
jgi:lysophospholipase L1-like esterase